MSCVLRIHHLNCVSSCPLGGLLVDGVSKNLRGRLVCHCLLIEAHDHLILADTGFGLRDVAAPRTRLSGLFLALTSSAFREEMTAVRQIQALGFHADDVRDIVLTHLDFDHAGGLDDFPAARVHLLAAESESAQAQRTWLDRRRYRPQQWSSRDRWVIYEALGGDWFGFRNVCEMNGVPPELLLVPLAGHTLGHAGIAVEQGDDWLLTQATRTSITPRWISSARAAHRGSGSISG